MNEQDRYAGVMRVKTPDRHSPFEIRHDLSITVSTSPNIPSVRDLPSFKRKIDWDNNGKKILPDSLLCSYSCNPDTDDFPGTMRVKTPDRHSPFEIRPDLSITVSTSPNIPSVRDLPSFREEIVW